MWSEFSDRSTFVCAIEPALTNFYDPNKELNEAREFKQKSAITKLGSHLAKKISDMSHRGMSNRNRTFQESLSSSKGTNYVELKRRGVWVIQRIAPNVSSVTFVTNLVDEGIIPGEWCFHFAFPPLFLKPIQFNPPPPPPPPFTVSIVNAQIDSELSVVNFLKNQYQRNGSIVDAELRQVELLHIPRIVEDMITDQQEEFVNEQMQQLLSKKEDTGWEKSKVRPHSVSASHLPNLTLSSFASLARRRCRIRW